LELAVVKKQLSVLCIRNGEIFKHDVVDSFMVTKLQSRPADLQSIELVVSFAFQIAVEKGSQLLHSMRYTISLTPFLLAIPVHSFLAVGNVEEGRNGSHSVN
jgi:hypothetical protein